MSAIHAMLLAAGTAGTAGTAPTVDFFTAARQGSPSAELFTLPTGVSEFDLSLADGVYQFFYDDRSRTVQRSASTVAGLASATDTVVNSGRYPTAQKFGSVWHLWTWSQTDLYCSHYTATAAEGPYTYADRLPNGMADPHVRQLGDGLFYAAYKTYPGRKTGLMHAPAADGPWTDLGLVWSAFPRAPWHSVGEADPAIFEYGGSRYISFLGWDGYVGRLGLVRIGLDGKPLAPAVTLHSPTAAWEQRYGSLTLMNPVWLEDRFYYSHQPNTSDVDGWAEFIPAATVLDDGRTDADAFRADFVTGVDIATNIPLTLHGSGALSSGALSTSSSTGGAYGLLNIPAFDDFTFAITFTPTAITGGYQLLFRAATYRTAANPIFGAWINATGQIFAGIHAADGVGNYDYTSTASVLVGSPNTLEVHKLSGVVTVTLNGVLLDTGSHTASLVGLVEWSLANQLGRTNGASQQFAGTLSTCRFVAE